LLIVPCISFFRLIGIFFVSFLLNSLPRLLCEEALKKHFKKEVKIITFLLKFIICFYTFNLANSRKYLYVMITDFFRICYLFSPYSHIKTLYLRNMTSEKSNRWTQKPRVLKVTIIFVTFLCGAIM
jgi:uncharacterized membrane protein